MMSMPYDYTIDPIQVFFLNSYIAVTIQTEIYFYLHNGTDTHTKFLNTHMLCEKIFSGNCVNQCVSVKFESFDFIFLKSCVLWLFFCRSYVYALGEGYLVFRKVS